MFVPVATDIVTVAVKWKQSNTIVAAKWYPVKINLIRIELNSFIIEKSHFNSIEWETLKKRKLVSDIY